MRTAIATGVIVLAANALGCGGGSSKPAAEEIEKAFLSDVRTAVSSPGHDDVKEEMRKISWRSMSNEFAVEVKGVEVRGGDRGCDAVAIVSAAWTLNGRSATGSGAGDLALQARGLLMGSSVPHRCCWSQKTRSCAWSEALAGTSGGANVERASSSAEGEAVERTGGDRGLDKVRRASSSAKREMAKIQLQELASGYVGSGCPSSLAEIDPRAKGVDPWGKELRWMCGDALPPGVRGIGLVSAGPDGRFDSPDDVRSW